jgi:phospholipase C
MHHRFSRLTAVVVITALGAFGAVLAVPPPSAGAATSTQPPPTSVIKHVIVVMQSGHSFDNYFGTRHGVSGIPSGVCLILVAGSPGCVKPYHLDPGQSRAGLSDTLSVTQRSINGGKMDGFARAQPNASIGATSMGYLNRQDLPYYWNLADRFTLYDHFFATSRAGALPNRVAAVAGQNGGLTGSTVPTGGISVPTVFDQLDRAGLSWKYYVENYKGIQQAGTAGQQTEAPVLAMPAITGDPARASHIVDTNQYFDDLLDGKLPAVSYVAGTVDSERSPLDPTLGEYFVKSLINALMQSSAWKDTVLLLTYDSSGGWYDNVPPPVMGGVAQGIRVPMLMVSPFARAGVVDHSVLNTSAIPGMIDQIFGLPVLTSQTAAAGDLLNGADLKQAPIAPLIATQPGDATVAPRPDVLVVYGLYLFMFLATVLLSYLAYRRYRRPDVAPDGPPEPDVVPPPAGEDNGSGEDADAAVDHRRVTSTVRAR